MHYYTIFNRFIESINNIYSENFIAFRTENYVSEIMTIKHNEMNHDEIHISRKVLLIARELQQWRL